MRMNAVLSNPKHPEYGQFTVPLPIPHNQYDGIMEALNAMDMGDPLARDCQMDEILGEYPILKRLEGKTCKYRRAGLSGQAAGQLLLCTGGRSVPGCGGQLRLFRHDRPNQLDIFLPAGHGHHRFF